MPSLTLRNNTCGCSSGGPTEPMARRSAACRGHPKIRSRHCARNYQRSFALRVCGNVTLSLVLRVRYPCHGQLSGVPFCACLCYCTVTVRLLYGYCANPMFFASRRLRLNFYISHAPQQHLRVFLWWTNRADGQALRSLPGTSQDQV